MSKQELLQALRESGQLHRFKETPLWKQAFKLYMSEGRDNVSLTCNTCYRKVFKWLKS